MRLPLLKIRKAKAMSLILLIAVAAFAPSVLHVLISPKGISTGVDRLSLQSHSATSRVINSLYSSPLQFVSLGTLTGGAVYAPANGYIYVGEVLKPAIAVINPLNGTVVSQIKLVNYTGMSSLPFAMVYDKQYKSVYVGMDGGVAVINTTTNEIMKTIGVPGGGGVLVMAEDPQTGAMLVGVPGQNEIMIINTSTNRVTGNITLSQFASGLAYDPVSKTVFVSGGYGTLFELNASDYSFMKNTSFSTYIYTLLYASGQNSLMLGMGNSQVYLINASTGSVESKMWTLLAPSIMTLDPVGGFLYISDANNVSEDIECINISNQYNNFLISSQGYVLGILWDSVSGQVYATGGSNGLIVLSGGGRAGTYAIQFAENGLPAGQSWLVNVSGFVESTESGNTISFFLLAGNYLDTAFSSGYFVENISGGSVVSVSTGNENILVNFSEAAYPVVFHETGLKKGTSWSIVAEHVVSNGAAGSGVSGIVNATSSNPFIEFSLTNGTYVYYVLPVNGYNSNQITGELNITGSNASVQLRWSAGEPPFLYRDVFGIQVFIWIQFIEVIVVVAGTILSGELVRRARRKK